MRYIHLIRLLTILIIDFINLNGALAYEKITTIRDDETESVIKDIATPIFQAAGLSPSSISINIINQETPNAFVMDGQNIFISTGLIKFSNNPDVLAGVIAHETGHIKGGHLVQHSQTLKNATSQMLMGFLAAAAAGALSKSVDVVGATMLGAYSQTAGSMMSFSRAQENAADNTSLKIMKQLCINSEGLINFLQSLNNVEKTFYNDVTEYERTHPLTKNRIEFIKSTINPYGCISYLSDNLRERFKMVYAKIFAFTSLPQTTFRHFNISDNSTTYAFAIANFMQHKKKESITEINKLVRAFPNSPHIIEMKGQILYELGQVNEAIDYYHKAHRLKPNSDVIALEYANVLILHNKNLLQAVALLKRVISHNRSEAYAWHLLGKAYKLLNDDVNMHIALAYDAYNRGDYSIATKHINALSSKQINGDAKIKLKDIKQLIKSSGYKSK